MKKWLAVLTLSFVLPISAFAGGGHGLELEEANNSLSDQDSLQRGAILYSNYCMACHSTKYIRYNRIARDIGWTDEEIVEKMTYGQNRAVDVVMARMEEGVDMEVLGTSIPDLSLMARLKGTDYIYTFLKSYDYNEEKQAWDNKILKGTVMPNVLEGLQRHSTDEEYTQAVRDISNYLEYVGEPAKMKRHDLGWKVMLFLFVFFIFAYLLKKEYWKDVH